MLARLCWKRTGSKSSVRFDGARVLAREESHADLLGFYHTHPDHFTGPSSRDDATMYAWSFCFGKPLLCVIGTNAGLRAWLYDCSNGSPSCKEIIAPVIFEKSKTLVAHLSLVLQKS